MPFALPGLRIQFVHDSQSGSLQARGYTLSPFLGLHLVTDEELDSLERCENR